MEPVKRKKKEDESRPIAPWVLTFGDMMTQILCFFIILFSISDIKKDKMFQALKSIQSAFKYTVDFPREDYGKEKTFDQALFDLALIHRKGRDVLKESPIKWTPGGKETRVESIREGLKITVGGKAGFAKHSAEINPQMKVKLTHFAGALKGYRFRIEIRGHASAEPFGNEEIEEFGKDEKNTWKEGKWNLSYRRAYNVAKFFSNSKECEEAKCLIERERLRIAACGDTDPLKLKFDERMNFAKVLGRNRRVEIIVTEEKIKRSEERSGNTGGE